MVRALAGELPGRPHKNILKSVKNKQKSSCSICTQNEPWFSHPVIESVSREACQLLILMGGSLMCMSWAKRQGMSSVSFMAMALLSNPRVQRYAYNCGIRRISGMHLIRRRAQRALGPFRTGGRETY